ncbi:MAG TPA: sigma-54 dependent transcriptional regulator [Longimicrobiaceae bacterium]|nr:sigma-54 dependent transcriptional regulator [Longimicrobiaceae bacterium]
MEVVVITTDDLEPAVRLRAAFESAGFGVELLTSSESLKDVPGEAILLVLSGGLRERRARDLIAVARERGRLPVLGLLEPTEAASREACRRLDLSECISKPVDVDEVVLVGSRLVQREQLREITGIIGETDIMEEVLERVVQIAPVDATVLIQGESGTGKELVARGIHALSPRRHKPFIAVNVAALPDNLLESELFGHEKGAFTGASSLRKGLFELANLGTIFLDEIGEMPLVTQTKLLRVLEEQEFRRVGGETLQRVDVRVIAATNRALREQVELGEFRRDLYHRLNVLQISLPPLRERREDIPLLIEKFVGQFARQYDRPFKGIDPEAFQILVDYAWPGNVRELRNLVESMVVLAPGRIILPADIPEDVRGGGRTGSLLPALARRPDLPAQGVASPELEFVLRTLFDLKMDMDELRREFESYRSRHRSGSGVPMIPPIGEPIAEYNPAQPPAPDASEVGPAGDDQVVYRPGMTMNDLEREAIRAALQSVGGNRRQAAQMLEIGERTLYRKIKELDV